MALTAQHPDTPAARILTAQLFSSGACAHAALQMRSSLLARQILREHNNMDVLKRLARVVEQAGEISFNDIKPDICEADLTMPKCMATCRVRTEFAHTQPYPCIRFEPQLVQHLRRLARRPFSSPMGGERFDRTVSYCMQHDRMPGPEVERPDLPFKYGRFEASTDS